MAGQSRAEQSRAEQSRAEQIRAGQIRAGQGRAGQRRSGQSRAEQSRAGQSRAEQDRAEQRGKGRGAGCTHPGRRADVPCRLTRPQGPGPRSGRHQPSAVTSRPSRYVMSRHVTLGRHVMSRSAAPCPCSVSASYHLTSPVAVSSRSPATSRASLQLRRCYLPAALLLFHRCAAAIPLLLCSYLIAFRCCPVAAQPLSRR